MFLVTSDSASAPRFPAGHFNRLLGIYGTVASALLFLQYPHFMWAQHMYYAVSMRSLLHHQAGKSYW